MAQTQISRIQHRRGPLADLAGITLNSGEFGWAVDDRRLFIGNRTSEGGPLDENIEIITALNLASPIVTTADALSAGNDQNVQVAALDFEFTDGAVFIRYSLQDGTIHQAGILTLISDGSDVGTNDDANATIPAGSTLGITFNAITDGNNITLRTSGAAGGEILRFIHQNWAV